MAAAAVAASSTVSSGDRDSALHSRGKVAEEAEHEADLINLDFDVFDVSYSCPNAPASNLCTEGKEGGYWKGGKGEGWVLIKLKEKCLLSFLRVHNKACSVISVSISLRRKTKRDFVTTKSHLRLPHGVVKDITIGHLPCRYIQIRCEKGAPISLYSIQPVGIPARVIGPALGPSMEDLIYRSTQDLLFGPSLPASQGELSDPLKVEELTRPCTYGLGDDWLSLIDGLKEEKNESERDKELRRRQTAIALGWDSNASVVRGGGLREMESVRAAAGEGIPPFQYPFEGSYTSSTRMRSHHAAAASNSASCAGLDERRSAISSGGGCEVGTEAWAGAYSQLLADKIDHLRRRLDTSRELSARER